MNESTLAAAMEMAARTRHVFLSTADSNGWPHQAAAGRVAITPEKHLAVTEWFCPGTVSNLQANPRISVVVWDAGRDAGYQIIGEVEKIKDLGMLDGYSHSVEDKRRFPQVERQLLVHVDRILEFKRSPHTDVEE